MTLTVSRSVAGLEWTILSLDILLMKLVRGDSSFLTTRPHLPEDDFDSTDLKQHKAKLTQELDCEYLSLHSQLTSPTNKSTELTLTRKLNQLRERISGKTVELQKLKGMYLAGTDYVHSDVSLSTDFSILIPSLERSVASALHSLFIEDSNTEVLLNMQNRIRAGQLIMKDRFLYYEFALSKLRRRHRTALESKRIAGLCEGLSKLEKGVVAAQRKASAGEFCSGMEGNREHRERLERERGKSLDRMAGDRKKWVVRSEERERLLQTLKQNLHTHTVSQSLLTHKSAQLALWLNKLRVIQSLLSAQDITITLTPALGVRDVHSIVEGYFRLMRTETSLTTQYQDLSAQSEEKQAECQRLRSEVETYKTLYELKGDAKLGLRGDLESAISAEVEKASRGPPAEQKDRVLLEVHSKLSDLAKRSMQRLSFIHERTLSSPTGLFRFTQSLLTYLRKNPTLAKETVTPVSRRSKILPASFSLPKPPTSQAEEPPSPSGPLIVGMPLPRTETRLTLQAAHIPHFDLYLSLYKDIEIANYFTDIEGVRTVLKDRDYRGDGKELFRVLVEKAYEGFGKQLKEVSEANRRLVVEVKGAMEGMRAEVVDFYQKRSPDGGRTFSINFSKQLEASDNYDIHTIQKLSKVMDIRTTGLFQQYTDPETPLCDSLPKLAKPDKAREGSEERGKGQGKDEEWAEKRYLSRAALLSPKGVSASLAKFPTSPKRPAVRHYSRECSPEANRWFELLHSVKHSDLQIRQMKAKETLVLSSLPPKLFLIPAWRKGQGWSVGRRGKVKSETVSPSTSDYNISIHG